MLLIVCGLVHGVAPILRLQDGRARGKQRDAGPHRVRSAGAGVAHGTTDVSGGAGRAVRPAPDLHLQLGAGAAQRRPRQRPRLGPGPQRPSRGSVPRELMGLKDDVDFARFLSMGAVGAAAVARDLRERFGHQPIELERYSMANKVWQTKVKRLRIPDLVCVRCGTRIESRGKSKLEVRLSDSTSENREWHAGGMRPDDIFAFVRVDVGAATPVVGIPAYFTHASLQAAIDYAKKGIRKAASEGSELDISWPTWVPTRDGEFVEVRNKEIFYLPLVGGVKKYWQSRNWPQVHAYLARGEAFRAGDSIVAGVMPPSTIVRCQTSWDLARDLDSADGSDRYAAIKAAGALQVR